MNYLFSYESECLTKLRNKLVDWKNNKSIEIERTNNILKELDKNLKESLILFSESTKYNNSYKFLVYEESNVVKSKNTTDINIVTNTVVPELYFEDGIFTLNNKIELKDKFLNLLVKATNNEEYNIISDKFDISILFKTPNCSVSSEKITTLIFYVISISIKKLN